MDDDGNKSLNLVEFKKALKEMALKLTDMQMHQLFAYFDADKSGTIDFDEFLVGVRVR
jgi:Ca2+-binding EF-hand superfamily protein